MHARSARACRSEPAGAPALSAVVVSNREKVYWPEAGFTKGDLVDYYEHAAPALLPHLYDRPLTLHRFPNGIEGEHWYQTSCRGRPGWLRTAKVGRFEMCLVDDARSLIWVANLGTIELHPFLHRVSHERPDVLVLDLDPGPGADVVDCCDVALLIRERLGGVARTSGSVGLHVYIGAEERTYEQTKGLARALAEELAEAQPERVVTTQQRAARPGRVLVDWRQNDPTRSVVAPYSLRGTAWPTVSTPVTWEEVERCARERSPELLTFLARDVVERLDRHGDLFAPVLPR